MAGASFRARVYAFKFLDGFVLIYPFYTVMFVAGGLSPSQVAAALMAWSIVGFLLQIPCGVLADRWPRRWLLCGAQLARGAGFVVWMVHPGYAGFLAGMMLWGVKSALTNGTFEALVYDELHARGEADDYARVIGRAQGVGFAAVLATSLAAAGLIAFGYGPVLGGSIAVALAAAAAALALPRARTTLTIGRRNYLLHLGHGFAEVARTPVVMGVIAFAALSQAFGGGLEGFWPIFGAQAGLPAPQIALLVAALSAAQAAGAALAHRLRRAGATGFHGLFALAGALLLAAAASLQPWSAALVVLICGLFKVIDISFDARMHDAIGAQNRATIASVKSFAGQVAMTGMLLAFGALAQGTSYRLAFLACGAVMAAVGAGYLVAGRWRPGASA